MQKKTILTSAVSIAVCLSMITGSTFALFTDEAKVNVAVSSAKIDVQAEITCLETYSFGVRQADGTFENNGVAVLNEAGALQLKDMTPGDSVKLLIDVTNGSNVTVNYRVAMNATGELFPALEGVALIDSAEYSLEGGKTQWVSVTAGAAIDDIAVEIAFPENENNNAYQGKSAEITVTVEAIQGNAPIEDTWDGGSDTSWFDSSKTEFSLSTAEQIVGLGDLVDGGETFEGKTITLESDLNLYAEDANGDPIPFEPIGSYRNEQAFKGTFDGNGHTIANMSQNTWALDNGYYYGDLGMGFFGAVEDAYIKNLTMDGASLSGESAICGIIAGCSFGNTTYENITVTNSDGADYQYYSGGLVGWASGTQTFINCNLDESTTVAAQWGDFDNSTGGVIGGCGGSAKIYLKDCTIACRIDAYNDVTSSAQWYAYRRCGMIIGNTGKYITKDGTNYADAPQLVCENVTVIYGEWANYTYCEFAGQNWPYVRVQAGVSASAYSNPRYGVAVDANGNQVVDGNHVHHDGEDHNILCAFDQLYGGSTGIYGTATHEGVNVIYNNK